MNISEDQRQFFTQKNPSEIYDTVTFTHSEFSEPIRLVLNQSKSMTFNSNEYLTVSAKVTLPSQDDLTPKITLTFSRIYIGDEFKKVINQISPFGWQEPIKLILEQYSELSNTVPQLSYTLYVNEEGIKFNREAVEITASDDNPMLQAMPRGESNPIYTLEEYRGLEDA